MFRSSWTVFLLILHLGIAHVVPLRGFAHRRDVGDEVAYGVAKENRNEVESNVGREGTEVDGAKPQTPGRAGVEGVVASENSVGEDGGFAAVGSVYGDEMAQFKEAQFQRNGPQDSRTETIERTSTGENVPISPETAMSIASGRSLDERFTTGPSRMNEMGGADGFDRKGDTGFLGEGAKPQTSGFGAEMTRGHSTQEGENVAKRKMFTEQSGMDGVEVTTAFGGRDEHKVVADEREGKEQMESVGEEAKLPAGLKMRGPRIGDMQREVEEVGKDGEEGKVERGQQDPVGRVGIEEKMSGGTDAGVETTQNANGLQADGQKEQPEQKGEEPGEEELDEKFLHIYPFLAQTPAASVAKFRALLRDQLLSKAKLEVRRAQWAAEQSPEVQEGFAKWKQHLEEKKQKAMKKIEAKFDSFGDGTKQLVVEVKDIIANQSISRHEECQQIRNLFNAAEEDSKQEFLEKAKLRVVKFCLFEEDPDEAEEQQQQKQLKQQGAEPADNGLLPAPKTEGGEVEKQQMDQEELKGEQKEMSETMPETMPKEMPETMPKEMSEKMPETMPKEMPETMPDAEGANGPQEMEAPMPRGMTKGWQSRDGVPRDVDAVDVGTQTDSAGPSGPEEAAMMVQPVNKQPMEERKMSGKHRQMEHHVKEHQTAEMPNDDTAREEEEPQEPVAAGGVAAGGGGRASVETHLGGDSEPVIEQGEHGQ